MNLKSRIKEGITTALLIVSPVVLLTSSMQYMLTTAGRDMGYSKDFNERGFNEWVDESPAIVSVMEFCGRPGRELAYLTVDQYKFPWKGYKRHPYQK